MIDGNVWDRGLNLDLEDASFAREIEVVTGFISNLQEDLNKVG